jgi:predicted kinase
MTDGTLGAVVIVSGPAGAGKSTVAARLASRYPRAVHLRTDDFWHFIVAGAIPPYLPESDAQNHTVVEVAAGAAFTYAEGGFTVVIDGIIGPWMLDHYLRAADRHPRIIVDYIVLRPDRAETLRRAQRRHAPALVDRAQIVSLWDQFADLGPRERHVIDSSDHSAMNTVDAIAIALAARSHRLDSRTSVAPPELPAPRAADAPERR